MPVRRTYIINSQLIGGEEVTKSRASTLPDEAFDLFPQADTLEVHLATGFQNMIFDSPYFPKELLDRIYHYLRDKYASEMKQGDTPEQFLYRTRKRAFGDFKKELWNLPRENLRGIGKTLKERFSLPMT